MKTLPNQKTESQYENTEENEIFEGVPEEKLLCAAIQNMLRNGASLTEALDTYELPMSFYETYMLNT